MASFAHALRSFRSGEFSEDELFAEVERILEDDRLDKDWLLGMLTEENTRVPLPGSVHYEIKNRIEKSAGEKRQQGGLESVKSDDDPVDPDAATRLTTSFERSGEHLSPVHSSAPVTGATAASTAEIPGLVSVGDVLNDRFELVECVGAGGMSAVYKALDRRRLEADDRNPYVAVKVLNLEFRDHPQSLIALQREAKKSQSLAHPNIVRVYDFDRDGDTVYMTMEYLSGKSLSEIVQAPGFKGMPEEEALRILEGMADALRFAHENGIVHADFKPANVFLTDDGQVKVIDFGIARAFPRPEDRVEMEKTRFDPVSLCALTPAYASPEMLEMKGMDPRDDIYALACVAYEMLCGRHPFVRLQATQARDGGLQVQRTKGLSQRRWKALKSALEFNRDHRTATVAQFCRDMQPPGRGSLPVYAAMGLVAAGLIAFIATGFFYLDSSTDESPVASVPDTISSTPTVSNTDKRITATEPAAVLAAKPAIKQYTAGETFRDCPTCPQLIVIPTGSFMQGSPESESGRFDNEGPQRLVNISYPFAVGQYEVTVDEFGEFVADTGYESSGCRVYQEDWIEADKSNWSSPGFDQDKNHPVSCVSWKDTQAYIDWLVKKTNHTYRLLSASEWEYVARANSKQSRAWGDKLSSACKSANVADLAAEKQYSGWQVHTCADGYVHTAPVGSFEPNEFGVYDTLGNVFEWIQDCWNDSYRDAPTDGAPWEKGNCGKRVLRGGSWFSMPDYNRSAFRNRFDGDYRSSSFGFRIARVMEQ